MSAAAEGPLLYRVSDGPWPAPPPQGYRLRRAWQIRPGRAGPLYTRPV
jgi:hypothetical protein